MTFFYTKNHSKKSFHLYISVAHELFEARVLVMVCCDFKSTNVIGTDRHANGEEEEKHKRNIDKKNVFSTLKQFLLLHRFHPTEIYVLCTFLNKFQPKKNCCISNRDARHIQYCFIYA